MKTLVDKKTYNIIKKIGKPYYPKLLPDDIPRYPIGKCFDACALIAVRSKGKYRYVEGLAAPLKEGEPLILHAWLTDENNSVFDPTWQTLSGNGTEVPMAAVYYGVEFPTEVVLEFMNRTGYQGLIANRHRAPAIVEPILIKEKAGVK